MVILGLTGSIGMGKTTAANAFRSLSISVYDADNTVHNLMLPGGDAAEEILKAFPDVEKNGRIDRQTLGTIVFPDRKKLKLLENILHPLVKNKRNAFLANSARKQERLVVLDIPLLLETGNDIYCDAVAVVSAPSIIQKHRVLKRPGMTYERFQMIKRHQMADHLKCRIADFVIQTGLGHLHSLRTITKIVSITKNWRSRCWHPAYNK